GQDFPQTIDERLVLAPNGGALSVWGSSGSGVSHGHDYLARGFFNQLWGSQPGTARLGQLIQAGYLSLFQGAYACCGDSIRTYLLLGDPLTRPRVSYSWVAPARAFLPLINR
ncbi:MAG: C25 family cysteine peptidase, partial [Thermoflexales bacterium]